MKKILILTASILLFLSGNLFSMSQEERIEDARTIINLFTQQYGPLKWKEEFLKIDFQSIANSFINQAKNAATDKDFYEAVSFFLNTFKDAHISYNIPSSLVSYLPFETEYFNDAVVVTYVNDDWLKAEDIKIEVGDKLIEIDGRPIEDIISELGKYKDTGHEPATRKLAGTYFLTARPQKFIPYVPKGAVTLTFLSADGSKKEVLTKWRLKGVDLAEMPPKSSIFYLAKAASAQKTQDPLKLESSLKDEISDSLQLENIESGGINSLLDDPLPFFPIWKEFESRLKHPFYTGTFNINGKRIGFIRINSWNVPSDDAVSVFAGEIKYMNDSTDALIIDQTNNGGGSGCYMTAIASFFITQPKDEIRFRVRANRSWLSKIESWFLKSSGDEKVHAKHWLDNLRSSVTGGDYLSEPLPVCSFTGKVFPPRNIETEMPVVYIKPVLVLINELDFSAADMFPALMKDWGTATLFGTRTAGAGGNRIESWPIGNSELEIKLTQSLMYRSEDTTLESGLTTRYIENVGVEPDIKYEITSKDYYESYSSYISAVEKTVLSIIEENK